MRPKLKEIAWSWRRLDFCCLETSSEVSKPTDLHCAIPVTTKDTSSRSLAKLVNPKARACSNASKKVNGVQDVVVAGRDPAKLSPRPRDTNPRSRAIHKPL